MHRQRFALTNNAAIADLGRVPKVDHEVHATNEDVEMVLRR
jgi:hypothetical protein